jgi:hypothetical protein
LEKAEVAHPFKNNFLAQLIIRADAPEAAASTRFSFVKPASRSPLGNPIRANAPSHFSSRLPPG